MFAAREAQRFLRNLETPGATQEATLLTRIVAPNESSEFGRRHSFGTIGSVPDYRRAVPVRGYEDFREDIQRVASGESGVLVTEPVRRLFLTSGSTGEPKYVPVTSSFIRDKSRAFAIFWSLVFDQHPQLEARSIVTNFSDSGEAHKTEGGLPCCSESSFWAGVTAATQRGNDPILPTKVIGIEDPDSRYYAIARVLLEEDFRAMMTLNPSTLLLLFQKLNEFSDSLIRDLERGGLAAEVSVGSEVRRWARDRYRPNPARARELRAVVESEGQGLLASRIWPSLELVVCWRSPMLKPYLDLLRPHLEGVSQRDYISMASEGVMAIPIRDGDGGGPLATSVHFYEFIPEEQADATEPEVLLPEELEEGRTYVMVLSNSAGLYRYNIGDVFRVAGFEARTPILEFEHRTGASCSLTGEKLTEIQVTAAAGAASRLLGLEPTSFTLQPAAEGFPRYVLLAEFEASPGIDQLQSFLRSFEEELCRQNVEYEAKRSSERLGAPELWAIAAGGYERRRMRRVADGMADDQQKATHLTRDSAFHCQFEVLERVDAG